MAEQHPYNQSRRNNNRLCGHCGNALYYNYGMQDFYAHDEQNGFTPIVYCGLCDGPTKAIPYIDDTIPYHSSECWLCRTRWPKGYAACYLCEEYTRPCSAAPHFDDEEAEYHANHMEFGWWLMHKEMEEARQKLDESQI